MVRKRSWPAVSQICRAQAWRQTGASVAQLKQWTHLKLDALAVELDVLDLEVDPDRGDERGRK